MVSTKRVPPTRQLQDRVSAALGATTRWRAPHTGLSAAERFVVEFADGSSAFVKAATDAETEAWLRTEHEVLRRLSGAHGPRPLEWLTDGGYPVLVCEDLSQGYWPADSPPVKWSPEQLGLLFEALREIAAVEPVASLPLAEAGFEPSWPRIARVPDALLALDLCSEAWLTRVLDDLVRAEARVPLAGDALVHNDVRSDNVCFLDDRVVFVDWGGARRGNRQYDLASLLTTLPLEGGPAPFSVMPDGGPWAAYWAGRSLWRASEERDLPAWFRRVLCRIGLICLEWAERAEDLPPRDGIAWSDLR